MGKQEYPGTGKDRMSVTRPQGHNGGEWSVGSKFGVIGAIANYFIAKIAPRYGVSRLARQLGSQSNDTAAAAYMALVRLGPKCANQLLSLALSGCNTAAIIQVIGDLGEPRLISDLEQFVDSDDPSIAATARESIEALREVDSV